MIEFQKNNASLSFSETLLKGKDGITPHIGENGNWYLGDTDTGKPSRGEKGEGASDFIIKMTVEDNGDESYTVTSCDATVEQIDAAVAAEKGVVVIASYSGVIYELPMLQGIEGYLYHFGTFLNSKMITSYVEKIDESTSEWQFSVTQTDAVYVDYSNTALPNVTDVKGALDELVSNSHRHYNRLAIDKLSTDDANSTNLYINGRSNKIALEPKIYNYASYTSETLNLTNNAYYVLRQVHKLTINPPSTPTVAANVIWITFADEGVIELSFPTTVKYIGKIPTVKNGETWEVTVMNKVVSIQKVGEGA